MKYRISIYSLTILMLILTGCETFVYNNSNKRNDAIREKKAAEAMKMDVETLKEQVAAFRISREDLYKSIQGLQATTEKNRQFTSAKVTELEKMMTALDAAREKDRLLIQEDMRKKIQEITDLMRNQTVPVQRSESGYEHVVESGQTLSEIAFAYGVKISAIVEANDSLKSESSIIRVGQKLFIPE